MSEQEKELHRLVALQDRPDLTEAERRLFILEIEEAERREREEFDSKVDCEPLT